ncbi:acyltransferase family protein, partial [Alistipes onderdonkii]
MNRLISIDIAKAICIILVVIGHYNPDNAPEWYHTINLFIYTFHMPLFMFASGYVYA